MEFEGITDGFILTNNDKYIFIYLKNNQIEVKTTDKEYIDKSIYFTCMILYNLMDFTDIKELFRNNICNNRFKEYEYKDCKEYILKKQYKPKDHSIKTNMFLELIHS